MRDVLTALALAALAAAPASAQAPAPPEADAPAAQAAPGRGNYPPGIEAQTRSLAAQLRCPVCQGLSLEDSPTELSQQMKDVIRSQLAEGKTPDQVKAYFVGRYGEWILLEPKPQGMNLLVYVLPLLGLLAGAGVVGVSVRRWTRRDGDAAPLADLDDDPALAP